MEGAITISEPGRCSSTAHARARALACCLVVAVIWWMAAARAYAQSEPPRVPPAPGGKHDALAMERQAAAADASFGPILVIEAIRIEGNEATAERVIRRALPIRAGEALRAGDPRFRQARFKVLATGYFREVELTLRKGSQRGRVVLAVIVTERGTVGLDSLYFGTSPSTPWWAGLDITERNLLGTGLGLGGGAVFARGGDIPGASDQAALTARLDAPSIRGMPVGVHGAFSYIDASEPYRIAGHPTDTSAAHFRALDYTRTGINAGIYTDVTPLARLTVDGRVEWVRAHVPLAAVRELPDGSLVPIDSGLQPGRSRVVTVAVGFDRDTRPDPVLPVDGDRLVVMGELGGTWMGGSYDAAVVLGQYQRWWPISANRKHVVSAHLSGGLVLGQAARFDRLHVSDMNRLLTPRALGLVLSTTASPEILSTSAAEVTYGEVGGSIVAEYSYQLFRSHRHVYGGNLFVGAGLWALASTRAPQAGDRAWSGASPVELMVDAGLRIDTEIGIFELTFANALGRARL